MTQIQSMRVKELTEFLNEGSAVLAAVFIVPIDDESQQYRLVLRVSAPVGEQDFTILVNKWSDSRVRVFRTLIGAVSFVKEHFLIDNVSVLTSARCEFNQRFQ